MTMNTYEIAIRYSQEVVDTAARHFIKRFVGKEAIADLIFLAIVIALWTAGILQGWLAWVLVGGGIALIGLIVLVALRYIRLARSKYQTMTDPTVTWRLTHETLSTESSLGHVQVPWETITKVWQFDEVWLLFFGGQGYSTLPTKAISSEIKAFIEERVVQQGGKVT